MREIISIHIGQAGIQLANSCWELYCLEHGLGSDGIPREGNNLGDAMTTFLGSDGIPREENNSGDAMTTFFQTKKGKKGEKDRFVPRSIFVDLEPTVIDQIKNGPFKGLYHPEQMLTGVEDAANNYGRGRFAIGKPFETATCELVDKLAESCNGLQGFLIFLSVGGGTGSGLGAGILEELHDKYEKKPKIGLTIFPSPTVSTSVVEPYNSVLATHSLLDDLDVGIMLDNEAIYNICRTRLNVTRPGYGNLNRLVAQVVSSLTASLRFKGTLNVDLNEFQTNLVPYKRIHFCVPSYAPIVGASKVNHEGSTIANITNLVFESSSMFAKCEPSSGVYFAVSLNYRGKDIFPKDVADSVYTIKKKPKNRFVDWSPTGIKMGINEQVPTTIPGADCAEVKRSVCAISNISAIADVFQRIDCKFDLLYRKRAFVHWYVGEGMDESEFSEAREGMATLENDYEELATPPNLKEGEEEY